MFVQISEFQAPLHKCKAPPYRRLSRDGSVATPNFSLAISLVTMVLIRHTIFLWLKTGTIQNN